MTRNRKPDHQSGAGPDHEAGAEPRAGRSSVGHATCPRDRLITRPIDRPSDRPSDR